DARPPAADGDAPAPDARPPTPDPDARLEPGPDAGDAGRPDATVDADTEAPDGDTPEPDAALPEPDAGPSPADLCALGAPVELFGLPSGGGAIDLVFDRPEEAGVLASACGAGRGVERVVVMHLPAAARVEARLEAPGGGAQLAVRTDCTREDTEVACAAPPFGPARVFLPAAGPGTLAFVVEGHDFEPAAQARLTVRVEAPADDVSSAEAQCAAADAPEHIDGPSGESLVAFDTAGRSDRFPTCLAGPWPGAGEQVFAFDLDAPSAVALSVTQATGDTVLALFDACDPGRAPVACDDDGGAGIDARLERPYLPAGTYFVTVEAPAGAAVAGTLVLQRTPLAAPACDDGLDGDADGLVDARDPGCSDALDPDEADPPFGQPTPDCGNGLDDDGDGMPDFPADPDCAFAGANAEAGPCGPGRHIQRLPPAGGAVDVPLGRGEDLRALPCASGGPDVLFALDLPTRSRVRLSAFDAGGVAPVALGAQRACAAEAPVIACRGPDGASPLTLEDMPAGPVYFTAELPEGRPRPEALRIVVEVESLIRACNDGLDNDFDGITDLLDPGCTFELDDDETHDPDALPACANGLDDDGDGASDYPADGECLASGRDSEEPGCLGVLPMALSRITAPGGRLSLRTDGRDRYGATCGNPQGPEHVVVVRVDSPSRFEAVVENNDYDTVLYLRGACDDAGSELACNDDTNGLASALVVESLAPGYYFLFLDGYGGAAGGADVVITLTPEGAAAPPAPGRPVALGRGFEAAGPGPEPDPTLAVFDPTVLHFVDITVAEAHLEALENDRENRVPCDIRFDGELLENSGIRQKGGIGSVSSLNGKPGFSIKFNEFERGQDLASLEKLVLNNAIQDRTLVHEHMGYELARRAGIPASRTAHAIVTLNGYTYGIYVVAEAVDDDFLRRWFGEDQDTGNLYEGPCCADFVQDIEHMELDDEDDGRTRDDLIELARIVRDVPDAELPAALEAELDMRSFILGYALDAAVFHWDGYAFNVNNHYLYRRPADDRFVFMPHGMDQLFQDVNFDPYGWPNGRLAQRVRELPAYDALYREALAFIATDVWDTDAMQARLDTVRRTLATAPRGLETVDRDLRWFEESLPFVRADYAIRKAVLRRGVAPPAPEVCTEITDGRARFALCPEPRTADAAAAHCGELGGTLAVPVDEAQQAFLQVAVLETFGVETWLGLSDALDEGRFLDPEGRRPAYEAWGPDRPNGAEAENCVVFDPNLGGLWNDRACGESRPCVCVL
ncbi:CotH kinase family protein, partial [Myxococcota bacterium]|nr:CotH kinase family protein [Myxococcota bacterium]